MDLKNKRVVVLGMGRTGIATAKFLGSKKAQVVVTDEKSVNAWGEGFKSIAREKWLQVANYDAEILDGASMVVPSPGVPPHNALLIEAQKRNIQIVGEIELAYSFLNAPLIAVTGTNGKTTTTTLVGQILKQANKKIFIGGNIGIPLIEYAQRLPQADFVVAEISSFQLQWVEKFHPFISVLLNMTNDHTDYHGSFAEYVRIKSKIFAEQTAKDITIINADDPAQRELTEKIRSKVVAFSSKRELREGIFVKGDQIIFKMQGFAEEMYPLKMIKLPGWHNVENVMAAVVAARFCDADRQSIESCVSNFYGLSHRIEYVGEKNSIKFYDDSKGTNVGAVVRALETFSQPVILLLGVRDKDGDFETLKPMLSQKAKKIILFGEARERISSLIGKGVKKVIIPKMRDAIEVAYKKARPGDIVLLSPGCASFDEFRDYKERGEYFKRIVRSL